MSPEELSNKLTFFGVYQCLPEPPSEWFPF